MGGTLLRHLLEFSGRITKLLHLLLQCVHFRAQLSSVFVQSASGPHSLTLMHCCTHINLVDYNRIMCSDGSGYQIRSSVIEIPNSHHTSAKPLQSS